MQNSGKRIAGSAVCKEGDHEKNLITSYSFSWQPSGVYPEVSKGHSLMLQVLWASLPIALIKKLHQNATLTGCLRVRVHFSEDTTYGEFIPLINYMIIDDHNCYDEWENNFYIFG